jgi:hypothetical protein
MAGRPVSMVTAPSGQSLCGRRAGPVSLEKPLPGSTDVPVVAVTHLIRGPVPAAADLL